ncbi:MAG: nicotinate phosphoribosyltransferase [Pseudomonadota bacterium]
MFGKKPPPADPPPPTIDEELDLWTDHYFTRARKVIKDYGDVPVTYAIFMRRPVVSAPRLAVEWLQYISQRLGFTLDIDVVHAEGEWVGAGDPIIYLTGPLEHLCRLEVFILQKIGASCVAATNAYTMAAELPTVAFIAMDARHCAGREMAQMMAYAASVGSRRAKRMDRAVGFIGNATNATAGYFGQPGGLGTIPHMLVGYAGSTLRAAEIVYKIHGGPLTVLVDYYGQEVTDSLEVCQAFPELVEKGELAVRIDTPGGRYVEGLDPAKSYALLERNIPDVVRAYRDEEELRHLVGPGVSAAAIYHLREALDQRGFDRVGLVASSGFDPIKCRMIGQARAPVNAIGTGSYLPRDWQETYATMDAISYDGRVSVKAGREFLIKAWERHRNSGNQS